MFYSCERCPAYCCSYLSIRVNRRDLRRLGKHFGLGEAAVLRRFIDSRAETKERVLRHRKDLFYGSVCGFLDPESRRCTVYEARPEICRRYPGGGRCGYYDFLAFERRCQGDPNHVATTQNPEIKTS